MSRNRKALQEVIIAIVVLAMVFSIWPALDIYVSRQFYADIHGFWLNRQPAVQALREMIWALILLTFLVALAGLVFSRIFRTTAPALNKVWEVIVMTYLLGPALLVDGILKAQWGRARPANITEFGGPLEFSPALRLSDQCPSNCSFVSGEGAGATAMLIAVMLVLRNQKSGRYSRLAGRIAIAIAVTGLGLRIVMGRHFLSDTLFAVLFVTLIALLLLQLKRYRNIRLF